MKATASILPLIVCLLTACGSYVPPSNHYVLDSRIVEQPRDSVWKRAVEYFRLLEIPEANINADSGSIETWIGVSTLRGKEHFDCGIVNGDTVDLVVYRIWSDLSIQPMNENRTLITLKCKIYAILDTLDTGGIWMGTFTNDIRHLSCTSRGPLETLLMDVFEGKRPPFCESAKE